MRKYSSEKDHDADHGHLDAELQHSMKLFRAQRNFYIAGFALFLCLWVYLILIVIVIIITFTFSVIRRLVILISDQAQLTAQSEALLKQAKGASAHASQILEQSTKSKSRNDSVSSDNRQNELHEQQLRKLREELANAKEELVKYRVNCESMKKQAQAVSEEYDRLIVEHEKLQVRHSFNKIIHLFKFFINII